MIPAVSNSAPQSFRFGLSEVWVRFLIAIVGLVLAFGAALFSTVSGESGSLWGTIILASAALLLATIVGLTTVPYLARRVVASRLREAMDYEVTRAGMIYMLITVVIGIAAINTGNNLLYVVVSSLLAAIIVSGIASAVVLRSLELDVLLPEHVFAARPMMARLLLSNASSWMPSFSVRVVPAKRKAARSWRWESYTFGWPRHRAPEEQWFRMPDRRLRRVSEQLEKPILEQSVYFPFLAPEQELRADLELCFAERGRYREKNFGLATRFPFAFLTKTRRINLPREIVVYPVVEPTDRFLEVLPMVTGEFETFVRGRGYDLYRIREYLPEDSARHVDWKATARTGSLKVREFSREDDASCGLCSIILRLECSRRRSTSARYASPRRSPGISIMRMWKFRLWRPALSRLPMCSTSSITWRWSSPRMQLLYLGDCGRARTTT